MEGIIKSTGYEQQAMIKEILDLHCGGRVDLDPTYSKGNFYSKGLVSPPLLKFDLYPQIEGVEKSEASDLPLANGSIGSMIYDPPFIVGHTKGSPTGIIGQRFHSFSTISVLWDWYSLCLAEFFRVLKVGGVLVIKCQDTVSSGKQWFSHVHLINEAERLGFYNKDLFVLLAKSRIIGHNHRNQKHARKFHSYFLVLEKKAKNKSVYLK